MAANKDVTVIILDVGKNAAERETKDGPTFLEEAKNCVEKILLRKLFTKSKDEVSLLLIGTETTENDLNEELGGYEHIANGFLMAPTNWDMVRYVRNDIDPPSDSVTADWLDGILVAMNYLKSLSYVKSNLKIILLTTFSTPVVDDIETVATGLKDLKIDLSAITTNIDYVEDGDQLEYPVFSQSVAKDKVREKSEAILRELLERSDGALCCFTDAIPQLVYYDKKQRRRVPWNCDLEVGQRFSIKIAAYIFLREDKEQISWKPRGPNGEKIIAMTEHYKNDELLDPEQLVGNVLKAHKFGGAIVPFDVSEQPTSGKKSLACIGFTKQALISDLHLAGTGIWAVVAQKGCPASAKMMAALTMAMRKLKLAMIARYKYGATAAPKMMVMFPNDMNQKHPMHNSLLMYELFYRENFLKVKIPRLCEKNTKPSAEQNQVIGDLIGSMDLMNAKHCNEMEPSQTSSTEAFKRLLNPSLQHMHRAIANRALNPKDPVLAVDKDLMDMLNPPPNLQEQAKPHIEKAKELFQLEVVKKKSGIQAFLEKCQNVALNPSDDLSANVSAGTGDGTPALIEIGTKTPAEDFAELLERGERFTVLATQLQKVIFHNTFNVVQINEEKLSKSLLIYREFAKQKGPFHYNDWIELFKSRLLEREKIDVWEKIVVREGYGLITSAHSNMSSITAKEAQEFYQIGGNNAINLAEAGGDDEDSDDLFNDM